MGRLEADRRAILALFCGVIAAGSARASFRAPDPLTQLIHDRRTGLALFGYDPVAFHSETRAIEGKPTVEVEALGFVWRFTKAANRAAFLATPDVYLPHFGGHDARGIGEGRMVEGDPAIFVMFGDRPAFFRTDENRDVFVRDEALRRRAVSGWPDVARQFAGH